MTQNSPNPGFLITIPSKVSKETVFIRKSLQSLLRVRSIFHHLPYVNRNIKRKTGFSGWIEETGRRLGGDFCDGILDICVGFTLHSVLSLSRSHRGGDWEETNEYKTCQKRV